MISRIFISLLLAGLLSACASTPQGEEHWRAMAAEDLAFIRDVVEHNHPGPVDERNPAFAAWMQAGYEQATAMLSEVKGYGSYEHVLRYYVNGFADEHINLNFWLAYRWQAWAGIAMSWNGEAFVVHHVADDIDLPSGSVLLDCDGHDPETLWQEIVLPYHARAGIPADRYRQAPRLLLDNSNPLAEKPQRCRFSVDDEARHIDLQWRYTSADGLQDELAAALPGSSEPLGIRAFGNNGAWISMPSFGVRGSAAENMKAVLQELRNYRNADFIVVDVRGNGGGSSFWGDQFVRELYGEDYFDYLKHLRSMERGPISVDYRASSGNLEHFENLESMIIEQAGEGSETHRMFGELVGGIRAAVEAGRDFYTMHDDAGETGAPAATEPAFKGRIIFLTDSICVSACLGFADWIVALPDTLHIGQPTSADTTYMEIRDASLPSGTGKLNFATKVYRGDRGRGETGYYMPGKLFVGDISNTAEVEEWILSEITAR